MKMQKHWYLGFLSIIGLYQFPALWVALNGAGHWSDLLNALWFIWFLYFIPEPITGSEKN